MTALSKMIENAKLHPLDANRVRRDADELKPLIDCFLQAGWTVTSSIRGKLRYQFHAELKGFTLNVGRRNQYPPFVVEAQLDIDLHKNSELYNELFEDDRDIYSRKTKFTVIKNPKTIFNRIMKEIRSPECIAVFEMARERYRVKNIDEVNRQETRELFAKRFKGRVETHNKKEVYFNGLLEHAFDLCVNHDATEFSFKDLRVNAILAEKIMEVIEAN